jgi:hypothetical protein
VDHRADFYIEKVRYSKSHNRIMWVSVRQDSGEKLGGAYNMVRKQMVSLIREGKQFMTIVRNPAGKYRKGKVLNVTRVKGIDYLRTDEDPIATDKLEDIPEY